MERKILITGVAGSGKSTISKTLNILGYEAYDIENINGLFAMYRKDTGELFKDYNDADLEKVKNADWLCDVKKLKELLEQQKEDLAFYCGIASNMDDIMPFFNKIIVLKISSDILDKRLLSREGTDEFANTKEGRQALLGWKDWWEEKMEKKGVIMINADGKPNEVVDMITKKLID